MEKIWCILLWIIFTEKRSSAPLLYFCPPSNIVHYWRFKSHGLTETGPGASFVCKLTETKESDNVFRDKWTMCCLDVDESCHGDGDRLLEPV